MSKSQNRNTMAKRIAKEQDCPKTLHRKLRNKQLDPGKNRE
jgi:hypothetical protein